MANWTEALKQFFGGYNQMSPEEQAYINNNVLRAQGPQMAAISTQPTQPELPPQSVVTQANQAAQTTQTPEALPQLAPGESLKTRTKGSTADDSDIRALLSQINQQGQTNIGLAQTGLSEQEALLQNYLKNLKPQVDISPLMALADQWYGGNLSKGYKAPMSGVDVEKILMGQRGQVAKAREGVAGAQDSQLKQQLQGLLKLRELQSMEEERQLKRALKDQARTQTDAYRDEKLRLQAMNEFDKQYADQLGQTEIMGQSIATIKNILPKKANLAEAALDPALTSAASQLSTAYNQGFAKLGALAGADLNLIQKGIGLSNDLYGMVTNQIKGSNPQKVLQMMTDLEKTVDTIYDQIGKKQRTRWGGLTDEYFQQYRQGYEVRKKLGAGGDVAQQPAKRYEDMTPEEIDAEYAKQFGSH